MTVHHGDCRAILATFADASIDAIVTDPPYELGFMGKHWDASGIAYDPVLWSECLRVLKPGGHLLAFGGTRTYHRMAVAIEDAGFEIRDSIHWLYGSGFPKSLDVSKAIDRQRDDLADIYRVTAWVRAARDAAGIGNRDIDDAFGANGMGRHWTDVPPHGKQPAVPTLEQVPRLLDVLGLTLDDVPNDIRRLLWDLNGRKGQPGENWWKREVVGTSTSTTLEVAPGEGRERPQVVVDITSPATDAARQWEGWGTALKPAHEPIVVARKPLIGTVAANVLQYGTGAINVDGGRVGSADTQRVRTDNDFGLVNDDGWRPTPGVNGSATGRWPANIVFTHAADCGDQCAEGCPVAALDEQSGVSTTSSGVLRRNTALGRMNDDNWRPQQQQAQLYGDTGGASRFFTVTEWDVPFRYIAKPSKRERNAGLDGLEERNKYKAGGVGGTGGMRSVDAAVNATPVANHHPTVKPLALMRWLVRLVTPPGGIVLDPFLGSGTTAAAAVLEGFDWVGCEMTAEYLPIIEGRVAWAHEQAGSTTREATDDTTDEVEQMRMFG